LRHSPVDGDHSLISLSPFPPPLTSFEPSGAHTTHKTAPLLIIDFFSNGALRLSPVSGGDQKKKSLANLWPSSVFRRSPFFGSHRMILLSSPPLARTLPSDEKATDQTQSLPFSQMSGNTYVTVVYASPPESTPLPWWRGKLATFCKMRLPVALELLELLARAHIPQPDRPVLRPTAKQAGIRRIETDAIYVTAAIFSNVSFTGTNLRLSPPASTPLPR